MKKILTISDHPLSPSGVGTQTKFFIEGLIKTGEYEVFSLAGAIRHHDYNMIISEELGGRWKILPVDGYGTQDLIREIISNEKPDLLWFMTDPRFWGFLWEIDDEIRSNIPMVYYHVWDNYPYPKFNKKCYDSNDVVVTISKVTDDIVRTVSPDVEVIYHPHGVPNDIFTPTIDKNKVRKLKELIYDKTPDRAEYFTFFWNSRNARRKQSGSLLFWFKELLDKLGHNKINLIMHTDVKDPHGQDLEAIIRELGMVSGEVVFSTAKLDMPNLAMMYSLSDCTIAVSDAEGFGLSIQESLSCGVPVICTMTGGMQEQVYNGEEYFGIGLHPASKAIIGSQEIPWIYEDRLDGSDVVAAMEKMYKMPKDELEILGAKGREHVMKNYSFENYQKKWKEIIDEVLEKYGTWDTRKKYKRWTLQEIK